MSDPIVFLPGSMNFESIREFKDCIIRGESRCLLGKAFAMAFVFMGRGIALPMRMEKGNSFAKPRMRFWSIL